MNIYYIIITKKMSLKYLKNTVIICYLNKCITLFMIIILRLVDNHKNNYKILSLIQKGIFVLGNLVGF